MKYISILILFTFCFLQSFAQPVVNRAGSANTVQDARLMGLYNLFVPRYVDTTAANVTSGTNPRGVDSCGAIIFLYTTNSIWTRACNPKRWIEVGSVPTWQQTLIIGSTLTQDNIIAGANTKFIYNNIDTFRLNGLSINARTVFVIDSALFFERGEGLSFDSRSTISTRASNSLYLYGGTQLQGLVLHPNLYNLSGGFLSLSHSDPNFVDLAFITGGASRAGEIGLTTNEFYVEDKLANAGHFLALFGYNRNKWIKLYGDSITTSTMGGSSSSSDSVFVRSASGRMLLRAQSDIAGGGGGGDAYDSVFQITDSSFALQRETSFTRDTIIFTGGPPTNFATADLTLTGARMHDFDNNTMDWFNVSQFQIYSDVLSTVRLLLSASTSDIYSPNQSSSISVNNSRVGISAADSIRMVSDKFIIDSIPQTEDTSSWKPLSWNRTTNEIREFPYWPGGSGGSGVTTLAAIGASPNANGATISGTTLNLEPASASFGGVMTTGAQTIAGVKTLSSNPILSAMTTGRVVYTTTGGELTSGAALTWDGSFMFINGSVGIGAAHTGTANRRLEVTGYVNYANATAISGIYPYQQYGGWDFVGSVSPAGTVLIVGGVRSSQWTQVNLRLSAVDRINITSTETNVNESGADLDFRIEGDNNANLFFADAGNDRIGIANSTPGSLLHVGLAGTTLGSIAVSGNTSGTITLLPQAAAGTYNWNWPTTAGSANQVLTSGGGGSTAMSWTTLLSSTYTPTLTNTTNISSSTSNANVGYTRIGDRVTVSGTITVTPTAELADCVLGVSLPVASSITNSNEGGGAGALMPGGVAHANGVAINMDATNDRATFTFFATSDSSPITLTFTFSYTVL